MKTLLCLFLMVLSFHQLNAADLPVEKGIITDAPQVPPEIKRDYVAKVEVELEVVERVGRLADGVDYTFWTFGGSVPGKFIRVREGDTVEFTLKNNAKSKVPHNIDLHAVTGPGGGAAVTATAPGQQSRFTFKALNPGLYVYHCATAPVGMHIANGMYGVIYVQPKVALPHVDREYYIFQSDFYTVGKNGEKGLQRFSQEKAVDERPTYVVFNGSQGSLVGDKALSAKVGETVRLFIGNGGPNMISSFHVIGEIFDKVYMEGGSKTQENIQTTLIPAGGATIVEFKVDVPGTYVLVDHSIFRAFHKGAIGMLKVDGEVNPAIYNSSKEAVEENHGDAKKEIKPEVKPEVKVEVVKDNLQTLKKMSGKEVFIENCLACHGEKGEGVEDTFPPLAKSDFLKKLSNLSDRSELIKIPLTGKKGKIKVNGKTYDGEMPPLDVLSDKEIAEVLSYVSNAWGNKAKRIEESEVRKVRESLK